MDAAKTSVETRLAAWEKILADENYRLRAMAGDDQNTLRAIEDLLSVPLVSGDDRNQLREKYLRIARSLVTATGGGATRAADKVAPSRRQPAPAGTQPLDPLLPSREHPAVTILDRSFLESGDEGADDRAESRDAGLAPETAGVTMTRDEQVKLLTTQGATVRSLLDTVRPTASAALAQTQQAVEQAEPSPQPAAIVRAGASRADRLVRAAAGLVGRPLWTVARHEPSRQLAELDLRFLLNWQAQQALDDFWGAGSGSSAPTPYFQTVVGEYLAACRELAQPLGVSSSEEKRLAEQTELLAQAAAQGIQTTSKDLLVDDAEPYLVQTSSAALAENLPAGVSALAVNYADGRSVPLFRPDQLQTPLSRWALSMTPQPTVEELRYAIRNQADLAQQRSLRTTVYFRGHAWQSEFFVQPAHGLEIVYEPPGIRLRPSPCSAKLVSRPPSSSSWTAPPA